MREDAWLGERFGYPAFTLEPDDDPAARGVHPPAFLQTKVPAGDVARVRELEHAGWGVVDANVTLVHEPGSFGAMPGGVLTVGPAQERQREQVLCIASDDYRVSRFHMDPAVPDNVARSIKRDWVEAYFDRNRGDRLLVAEIDGHAVGFLAILRQPDAEVIDLIAVRGENRGAGVGQALVGNLLHEAAGRVQVGTQAANARALRFYERMGFRARDVRYVLHRHL